ASVTEAQHSAKIAAENYQAALETFNRAPASEREYAGKKLDAATNAYQTAVIREKVAIKDWLTPPHEDRAPAAAPAAQVKAPTLIAPVATPAAAPTAQAVPGKIALKAIPLTLVKTSPLAPQAHKEPTVIAPEIAPVSSPAALNYKAPATPEARAPQNFVKNAPLPQAAPEVKHFKEPQNVVIPNVIAPQAAP
ncbi:hypothetical protein N1032_26820, partial [Herbiconiux sp. CPCC 203386]|nr:hypothetical protein [Herbiconiux daphne]